MSSTYALSPDGYPLIGFGPNANCTLDTCPVTLSVFQYRPSLAANATLLAVFGVLMCVHGWQGWRTRTWGYMGCVVAGCVLQMVGYGGRIMLYGDPFGFDAFLMQIICITVAPVFYCAAVYVLLAQLINLADPSLSRFPPTLFYYLFIPADITCLVLQATGGALSATGETLSAVDTGVSVSKAGLILQVVVLVIFLAFFVDYLVLYRKKHGGESKLLRSLRVFLGFTFTSVLLILVRCIYRVVELKDGYFGEEFRKQWEFVGLEGVVMCVAVICLSIGHPGWSLYRIKGQGMAQEDIELREEPERRSPSSSEDLKDQAI